jgi:hypothetical protein
LAKNNVDVLDPANPPTGGLTTTNIYPYAQFISGTENFGSLEGVIRDVNNIPVIGAIIQLGVAQLDAISDVGGVYRFAPLPGGTYQLTVSRAGYLDVLMPFVLADNQDMTLNITLPFVPLVDVSGVVVNSMNETVPVSDALITLEGEYNATTTSDTFGRFTLLNIPMNRFYNLKISKPGFDEATYPIQVGTQNLILGNLLLAERLMRPYNVQAVSTVPANGFNITWNAPYLGSEREFTMIPVFLPIISICGMIQGQTFLLKLLSGLLLRIWQIIPDYLFLLLSFMPPVLPASIE